MLYGPLFEGSKREFGQASLWMFPQHFPGSMLPHQIGDGTRHVLRKCMHFRLNVSYVSLAALNPPNTGEEVASAPQALCPPLGWLGSAPSPLPSKAGPTCGPALQGPPLFTQEQPAGQGCVKTDVGSPAA